MKNIVAKYIEKRINEIPKDLKAELVDELGELVKFESVGNLLKDIDPRGSVLFNYGLPRHCPGFIDFNNKGLHVLDDYIVIGSNNYGDKIIVNLKTGSIESINHDFGNRLEYINASIADFMEMVYRYNNIGEIKNYANNNDPTSIEPDRHWYSIINIKQN